MDVSLNFVSLKLHTVLWTSKSTMKLHVFILEDTAAVDNFFTIILAYQRTVCIIIGVSPITILFKAVFQETRKLIIASCKSINIH